MSDVNDTDDGGRPTCFRQSIQAQGCLSTGAIEAVDLLLYDIDLKAKRILDIGCGTGSVDVHLAQTHDLELITAVDADQDAVNQARQRVRHNKLGHKIMCKLIRPGPLPFDSGMFDVVVMRDAACCGEDLVARFREVMRVLNPCGIFAAGIWLAATDARPAEAIQTSPAPAGSEHTVVSLEEFRAALRQAGFDNIAGKDRLSWYRQIVRDECVRLSYELSDLLTDTLELDFPDDETAAWVHLTKVLADCELRPVHFLATPPATALPQSEQGLPQ